MASFFQKAQERFEQRFENQYGKVLVLDQRVEDKYYWAWDAECRCVIALASGYRDEAGKPMRGEVERAFQKAKAQMFREAEPPMDTRVVYESSGRVKFDDYLENGLDCPGCGNGNLHQTRVEIFERDEDARRGLHVSVENGTATLNEDLTGCPSPRRHGVKIQFSCEHCNDKPWLMIYQHKGTTYIEWFGY